MRFREASSCSEASWPERPTGATESAGRGRGIQQGRVPRTLGRRRDSTRTSSSPEGPIPPTTDVRPHLMSGRSRTLRSLSNPLQGLNVFSGDGLVATLSSETRNVPAVSPVADSEHTGRYPRIPRRRDEELWTAYRGDSSNDPVPVSSRRTVSTIRRYGRNTSTGRNVTTTVVIS